MTRVSYTSIVTVTFLACALASPSCWADSQSSIEALKASATKSAKSLRDAPQYKQPGCDVAAMGRPMIIRSRDQLLRAGDRIVAVNGREVQGSGENSATRLIYALRPSGTVRLTVERKQARVSVSVHCGNSADRIALEIAAYDAAAAGDFSQCAERLTDYGRSHVQRSFLYGLWRRCSISAGLTVGEDVNTTYLTYWTLRLQELRYSHDQIEDTRPQYLGALQELLDHGQTLLVDELRRQWTLATGESNSLPKAPPPPPPVAKSVLQHHNTPRQYVAHRSLGSSCEDGHWVQEVMDDGAIIELEDGSLWRVNDVDTVDSALWLATTEIVVCDGKLINTDDNESVEAERIR